MEYMAYLLFGLTETRVSGGDTLLYVPSGDIDAYADAVEKLIDDPALRAIRPEGTRPGGQPTGLAATGQGLRLGV